MTSNTKTKRKPEKKTDPKANKSAPKRNRKAEPKKPAPKSWKDPETGRYLPGNQYSSKLWDAKSSYGRKPIFETPEQLRAACYEYFEWIAANPLREELVFCSRGEVTKTETCKMQAMTINGLSIFLDIDEDTWRNYAARPEFFGVTREVEKIIYVQKFTGAAAELLNANIIARDLGLADKKEVEHGLKVLSHDPIKKPESAGTE